MIELTRLNGTKLYLNDDHIRSAEARPDTVITFTDGKRVVVRESPAQVADKVIEFRGRVMQFANRQGAEA